MSIRITVQLFVLLASVSVLAETDSREIKSLRDTYRKSEGVQRVVAAQELLRADPSSAKEMVEFLYRYYSNKNSISNFASCLSVAPQNAYPVIIDAVVKEEEMASGAVYFFYSNYKQLQSMLERDLTHQSPLVRSAIAKALGRSLFSQSSAPALKQRLKDSNSNVRVEAALALIKHKAAMQESIDVLSQDFQFIPYKSRVSVLHSLRHVDLKSSLPIYEEALIDDALHIRLRAATHLVNKDVVSDERLIAVFHEVIRTDPANSWSAVFELSRFGNKVKNALPNLKKLLESDDSELRQAAAFAIASIDPETAYEMLPIVAPAIADSQALAGHRLRLLREIGRLGPSARVLIPVLRSQLGNRKDFLSSLVAVQLLHIDPENPEPSFDELRELLKGRRRAILPGDQCAGLGERALPLLDTCIEVLQAKKGFTITALRLIIEMGPRAHRALPIIEASIMNSKPKKQFRFSTFSTLLQKAKQSITASETE